MARARSLKEKKKSARTACYERVPSRASVLFLEGLGVGERLLPAPCALLRQLRSHGSTAVKISRFRRVDSPRENYQIPELFITYEQQKSKR